MPQVCVPGTYMDAAGPLTSYSCASCPVDYYCPDWGITRVAGPNPYTNYPCPAGYLCEGGAVHPSKRDNISIKLCPVGYFCDKSKGDQTSKQLCPINFYTNVEGKSECDKCPAGYMCPELGTIDPEPCPRGQYCTATTTSFADELNAASPETIPLDCPAGTYNSQLYAQSQADCDQCPPGKYCEGGEQSYSGLCDKGYVCTGGQSTATPSNVFYFTDYADDKSGPCPVGHYCPTGSSFPIPCTVGTY